MMWSEGGQPAHLIFAGLRGGKGGSSVPANTSSTVTNKIDLPPFVQDLAQQNISRAENLSNQPYQAPPQSVAPINPLQQAGYDYVSRLLGGTDSAYARAMSQVENLPASTQSLLNPYLKDVEGAAVSNIQRQGDIAGQNLASGAVGQNTFGGTRYGVEQALLNSETQRNIGQTVSQIESQGWNTAMNAALQQAGSEAALATGGQNASLQGAQAAISAGGAQQTQQQAELTDALQRWQAQQNWPYQQLAVAQGALAGTPYGTTTTSTQPYAQNQTANLLGNIAAGVGLAGAGSNLFSSQGLFGSAGPLIGKTGLFGSQGWLASLLGGSGAAGAAQAGGDIWAGNTLGALGAAGSTAALSAAAGSAPEDIWAGASLLAL